MTQLYKLESPFSTVRAHPHLAVHVHEIGMYICLLNHHLLMNFLDITVSSGAKPGLRPREMKDCTEVLALCKNLSSFHCSPSSIQAYLPSLQNLQFLENLRINAQLGAEQTEMLVQLQGVKNLTLDYASWHVISALPRWAAEKLAPKLTSLTLYVSHAFALKYTLADDT